MRGERAAGRFLTSQGLTILGQNLRARTGEIDLAADDGGVLVFVEVRLRSSGSHGGAVGRMPPCRFDAVGLDNGALTWIRNAFAAES
jgi:putative endonuclease